MSREVIMLFLDRAEAGQRLGQQLLHLRGEDVVVLGLPRGGVPVALEVARALHAPLDVILVRKLGLPFQPELAMGAIGENGVRIIDEDMVRLAEISPSELSAVEQRERQELERRARRFRGDRPIRSLKGCTAVLVDDGVATGSTARAACQVARASGAARIILAVPVAPPDWECRLSGDADELVCLSTPRDFLAVGQFYRDFSQTSDDEVAACLELANRSMASVEVERPAAPVDPPLRDEPVEVKSWSLNLAGHLTIPEQARGIVLFAHGSGSSRHSPRNRYVASTLNQAGVGTLLFDLLSKDEEHDRTNVFDIDLLAQRLYGATKWLRCQPEAAGLPIGYFGASTGAAAALWAASEPGAEISAVVCRGGRPDLAMSRLAVVRAPTLLIVGAYDYVVLDLNHQARRRLRCENHLTVVPGATHLFEEPGTLEVAAKLACDWFVTYFSPTDAPAGAEPAGVRMFRSPLTAASLDRLP